MTKDRLISAMSHFCPPIIGVCPKCGSPIFCGYRCFECRFDASGKEIEPFKWDKLEQEELK